MTVDKRVAGSSVGFNGAKPIAKPGAQAMAAPVGPSKPSAAATADYERTRQAHNNGLATHDELAQSAIRAHQRIIQIGSASVAPYTSPEPRATESSQASGGRWEQFKAKFGTPSPTVVAPPTNPMTTLVANLNRTRPAS